MRRHGGPKSARPTAQQEGDPGIINPSRQLLRHSERLNSRRWRDSGGRIMPKPMNDLVVVLPGILGTELRKDGRLLWGFPEGVGGLVRARGDPRRAVADLTLRTDDPHAEDVGDGVEAVALVSVPQVVAGLIKTDGYDLIRQRL